MFKKIIRWTAWVLGLLITLPLAMNLIVIATALPRIKTADSVPQAPAVLVLGAGVWANSRLSPMLQDRVDQGIALYKNQRTSKMLMSGDHSSRYYDEVSTMKRYAADEGVPTEDIFLDHSGFSTYESVIRAKKIFGADRIIIVTQRYHLYRALFIARALGMDAWGVAADAREYAGQGQRSFREFLARVKDYVQALLPPSGEYGKTVDLSGDGNDTNTP
jgi:SanA protein